MCWAYSEYLPRILWGLQSVFSILNYSFPWQTSDISTQEVQAERAFRPEPDGFVSL